MLARLSKKHIILLGSLLFFTYFYLSSTASHESSTASHDAADEEQRLARRLDEINKEMLSSDLGLPDLQVSLKLPVDYEDNDDDVDEYNDVRLLPDGPDYREVFSVSSADRKFFPIFFGGGIAAYNPSIIPHPTKYDMWIVVAQQEQSREQIHVSGQVTCDAGFLNGVLVCAAVPTVLPVAPSIQGACEGELGYFNFRFGPRDARVFHGPAAPYIIYGSQSTYTCMSLWMQDVRMLLHDYHLESHTLVKQFKHATEVQRPPPFNGIEKNFFLFWDSQGKAYVHHEIGTKRVFAQLSLDGSVGPDLAPLTAVNDHVCMAKYMPPLKSKQETIHQATNSLSITLCKRSDPTCVPSDANTFIMTIFQWKSYYEYHGVYEPYVMLFHRSAPFAVHAISQRPLWIHGRDRLSKATGSMQYEGKAEETIPKDQTELFYITSMSWKSHGQQYDGYIDDVLFLGVGIEDSRAVVIDVLAADLLQDLAFCAR